MPLPANSHLNLNATPRPRDQWITVSYWLGWLAVCAALLKIVAVYGTGHRYEVVLYNSDAMYIPVLFRTAVDYGAWSGWDFPTSPFFFPDAALFFPVLALVPEIHLAVILYGICQLLLTIIGLWLLQRELFGNNALTQAILLLTSALSLLLIASAAQIFYPLALLSVHHMGVLVILPFALVALLGVLDLTRPVGERRRAALLLFTLTLLTAHSESLFIIHFVLPAFVAVLLWGKHTQIGWRHLLSITGGLLLSAVAGQWLRQFLVPIDKLLRYTQMEDDAIPNALANFSAWLNDLLHTDRLFVLLWLLALACLLAVIFVCLRQLYLRQANARTRPLGMVATFCLGAMVISVAAALTSGNFNDDYSTRYILPTIYLPFLVGLPLFIALWLSPSSGEQGNMSVGGATAMLALVAIGYALTTSQPLTLSSMTEYQDPFTACLERETTQRQLRRGLAGFWQATSVTALSEGKLEVLAIGTELQPLIWNNNRLRYHAPFEFVIIDKDNSQEKPIRKKIVVQRFGQPADSFECGTSDILVYNRPSDIAFQRWFANHYRFTELDQVGDEAEFYGYGLNTLVDGVVVGLSIGTGEEWNQEEGTLASLPLNNLPAGSYRVALDLYADNVNAGEWEVVAITPDGRQLLFSTPITATGKSVITGSFDLQEKRDVDIDVKYGGHGALFVDRIRVAHLDPAQVNSFAFTETAASSAASTPTLRLIQPTADASVARGEVNFVWQWTGQPLPKAQTFEVRLWPQGESIHYGAHDAKASAAQIRQIGDTYSLRLDLSGAHSIMQQGAGNYEWTIGIVAIEPAYQDLQIEAMPHGLSVSP